MKTCPFARLSIIAVALPQGDVWGRPAGVTVARDGTLLVSDDTGDCIWRVSYAAKQQ